MAPTVAIEVDGLTKRFGQLVAADQVRFDVPRGAIFGFLGPNGSGKTTTLGMLTGLIPPDEGTARILGHDVRADLEGVLDRTGAAVEEPAFYPYLTGRQNLRLVARLAGVGDDAIDRALARAGIAARAGSKYAGYSQGMRRRLALAAALLADPDVIILDEPTNGLDPAGQHEMRQLLREVAAEGRTILLSSHMLHDVQEVCTHVAVIHKGKVVAHGPMADILSAEEDLEVVVEDDAQRAAQLLRDATQASVVIDGARLRVAGAGARAAELNRRLVEAGLAVQELVPRRRGLEDRFFEMTREGS